MTRCRSMPFVLAAAIALADCAPVSGYRPPDTDPQVVVPGELYSFIDDVAHNRSTLENTVAGRPVRGVFLGHDGCDRVAVIALGIHGSKHPRVQNYSVCGRTITQTDAYEVMPSFPDDADARGALASAQHAALLYAQQRKRFQGYVIEARRLGIGDMRPCLPVETIITYDGNLVLHDVGEVCR